MSNGHTVGQRAAMSARMKQEWREGHRVRTATQNEHNSQALLAFWAQRRDERVLSKLDRSAGPDGCWLWTGSGAKNKSKKCGRIKVGSRTVLAHRYIYQLLTGEVLPDSVILLHNCWPLPDNPLCCNPKHLRGGTLQENAKEAGEKGQVRQGERHPNAKLTNAQVYEMRELWAAGGVTQRELAARYNVPQTNVSSIVHGLSWRLVAMPPNMPAPAPLRAPRRYLTDDVVVRIGCEHETGKSPRQIAALLEVPPQMVWKALRELGVTVVRETRLTPAMVVAIRQRHVDGEATNALARAFGVSFPAVKDVIERRTWKHVV